MDSLISVIMKERNFGRDIENLRNLIEEYQEAEKSDILKVNPNEISLHITVSWQIVQVWL